MILLVTGGRFWGEFVAGKSEIRWREERRDLAIALRRINDHRTIKRLVHGDCRVRNKPSGADRWSGLWADVHGIPVDLYAVETAIDGPWPAAGCIRNGRMLAASNPDGVLAMPGGNGTADMVRRAVKAGVRVWRPYG